MKFKKIILSIIAILIIASSLFIIFNGKNYRYESKGKINIVSSNFASYDFLRAIIGNNSDIELTFLIGPGKDAHGFEPTAKNLITIQNSDLFVYVGGEMEQWTDKVLEAVDGKKIKTICISEFVDTIEEQEIDGAEEEEHDHNLDEEHNNNTDKVDGAFDEHIWTSPSNAIKMVEVLEKAVEEIDSTNIEKYQKNAQEYIAKVQEVDKEIQEIMSKRVRDRLIFADRMPMQYFINYYNLKVSAAFSGCSTDIEPSASTIAYLENRVKDENIPVILYIELNDGTVAKTIAEGTKNNVEALQIQTLHNISLNDFKNGETWVSLMTRNIEVLKKALL